MKRIYIIVAVIIVVIILYIYATRASESYYFSNYSNHEQYEAPPKIGRIWKNCDSPDGMNDVKQCAIPTDFGQPSWFNIEKNYDMNLGIFKITN